MMVFAQQVDLLMNGVVTLMELRLCLTKQNVLQGCCLIRGRFTKLNFTSIKVSEYLVTWICLEKVDNYV